MLEYLARMGYMFLISLSYGRNYKLKEKCSGFSVPVLTVYLNIIKE